MKVAPSRMDKQVADAARRCQAGAGEINDPTIAGGPSALGLRGTGEPGAWASGDGERALRRVRAAFPL